MTKRNPKKLNLSKETLKALSVEQNQQVDGGATGYSCQTCYVNVCYTTNRHICWWD